MFIEDLYCTSPTQSRRYKKAFNSVSAIRKGQ